SRCEAPCRRPSGCGRAVTRCASPPSRVRRWGSPFGTGISPRRGGRGRKGRGRYASAWATRAGEGRSRVGSPLVLAARPGGFLLLFVRIEFGLSLVIFPMLLSPQLGTGAGVAEGRRIVIRSEDLLLLVVAFSWLAKTAVNKELGLTLKTPL